MGYAQALRALARLNRLYDGPVPAPCRQDALLGGRERAARVTAVAQSRYFDHLAVQATAMIARRRRALAAVVRAWGDGRLADLTVDLGFYRRRGRAWHDRTGD